MQKIIKRVLDIQSLTLFRNSSWVFLSNFFGAFLAFIKAIIIARILGAEAYGIFMVIIVFIGTIQEILNLNLGAALIRFGASYQSDNRPDKVLALIKAAFLASTLVFLGSIAATALFTWNSYDTFIKKPGLEWFSILYAVAAGALFFNQISRSALRLFFRFKKNSLIQMVMDITDFVIITITLLLFPGNLEIFLIAVLITTFINGIIPNIAAWRELKGELPSFRTAKMNLIKPDLKPIRFFVFNNSVAKTLQSLINKGDVLVLGLLSANPVQVAWYAVGKKLAYYILIITDPLVTSVYPQICKLREESKNREIFKMVSRLTLMTLAPGLVFIAVSFILGTWVVELIFGDEYSNAGITFSILSVAAVVQASFFWMQPLLQAFDLMVVRLKIYIAGIVCGIVAALIFVPMYGSEGMAISVVITNVVMYLFFTVLVVRTLSKTARPEPVNINEK